MGKFKKKAARENAPPSAADALPKFDENALSALTARIEKGLANPDSTSKKSTPKKASNDKSQRGKPLADQETAFKDQSKKRKRDNEKPAETKFDNKKPKHGKPEAGSNSNKGTPRDVLLKEILALGGGEEDLDLIGDAESGDDEAHDFSEQTKADDQLKKELASFVAGLGFEGHSAAVVEDNEDEGTAEPDGTGDWEDDSEASSEESEEPAPPPKATAPAVSAKDTKTQKEPKPTKEQKNKKDAKDSKDTARLIFEARPDWHAAALPKLRTTESRKPGGYTDATTELKKYAVSLLEADSELYASKNLSATSSHRFLSTIMTSGTLSDKISALTLVVQESPVHTTKSFENLLGLAKKRSREQAITALGAIKDLLANGVVLPADRKLYAFGSQPELLGTLEYTKQARWAQGQPLPDKITKAHLISWAFEDWLKESYFEMLKILEGWMNDAVDFARSRTVTFVYELLKEKPEQESNLLRLLVNKLGDPDKKIASRSSYLILQLQTTHPLMKPIIIKFIENELILRPGQNAHAKYYAIITLNQTVLSSKEEPVARSLLRIYFDLFVTLLKKPLETKTEGPVLNKKGQVQGGGGQKGKKAAQKAAEQEKAKQAVDELKEKMISGVLTGVNRALPFVGAEDSMLDKHMDTLFRITHSSNFNTSIQALILIQQLVGLKPVFVDRFYRTLYESLFDPRLVATSKHALYLNLLFKSLKSDLNVKRVKAFVKRLLQILTLHQPPFICGVLFMLKELEKVFPSLRSLYNDPEEHFDDDEEVYRDVPDEDDVQEADALTAAPESTADKNAYDGRKRDPTHSNADKSCLWEILPFLAHFHPSVTLFASRLLSGADMPPKPDLTLHTLIHFLDRFVYRNSKASANATKGSSIMQPLAGGEARDHLLSSRSQTGSTPLNSEAFWNKKAEDVAVDEVFFHKYFNQVGKSKKTEKAGKKKSDKAADEEDEDADEDEIWQALVESKPEIDADDDESDLDMADFDEDDDDLESLGGDSDGSDVDIEMTDDEVDIEGDEDDEDEEDLLEGDEEDEEDEEEEEEDEKPKKEDARRKHKKKLKSLPTFASVDDYAELLDRDEDEDQG